MANAEKVIYKSRFGLGTLSTLTIIFTIAKLFGLIDWSWGWVLFPIFLPIIIMGLIFIGFVLLMGILFLIEIFNRK